MSIRTKLGNKLVDVTLIKAKHRGSLKNISIIKFLKNGVWHTLWEMIVAYLFTRDGFGLKTRDGYVIKCRDQ